MNWHDVECMAIIPISDDTVTGGNMAEYRCGLYARVSTDQQVLSNAGSIDTQISRQKSHIQLKHEASEDAWEVTRVYREEGKSGKELRWNGC